MSWRARALTATVAALSAGLTPVGIAAAQPGPAPCSYTLSAPHVAQVSGQDMVTATLAPGACTSPATPYLSVACLQLQGGATAGQCAQADGPGTAQVYYPYRPGATYLSTGRGCATTGNPTVPACQTNGPIPATL